jgi:hypothetical protein
VLDRILKWTKKCPTRKGDNEGCCKQNGKPVYTVPVLMVCKSRFDREKLERMIKSAAHNYCLSLTGHRSKWNSSEV